MIKNKSKILILFAIFSILAGPATAENNFSVFVSIAPQKYFLQQIGKDLIDVHVMVPPGASPATYEPKPKQLVALSRAKAYFAIGVPFEKAWMEKLISANPGIMVVHTDKGIKKIPMKRHFHYEESENSDSEKKRSRHVEKENTHENNHAIADPHIWLSPPLVLKQSRTISNALCQLDPGNSGVYKANLEKFQSRVKELDSSLKKTFKDKKNLKFMVFHPAWGYFAQAYGLTQIPIEIEGKDPKPAELKELIGYAVKQNIQVIFVQPQFSAVSARVIAKGIGARIAYADPLSVNWMSNLREVADKFMAALK